MIPHVSGAYKAPRFAHFMSLANSNIARARVLEQLWFYCRKPRFPIGKQLYSSPLTDHLIWELGLSRGTVFNAISQASKDGVIEVRHRKISGRKRRCVRFLLDPLQQDIGPEPGKDDLDEEVHDIDPTMGGGVHEVDGLGPQFELNGSTATDAQRLKKKEPKGMHVPQAGHAPETGQPPETGGCVYPENFPGEASPLASTPQSPPPPALVPNRSQRQLADKNAFRMGTKRHWDQATRDEFASRLAARYARQSVGTSGTVPSLWIAPFNRSCHAKKAKDAAQLK